MARALLSIFLALIVAGAAFADTLTYENSRFGTRISFPADIFDRIDPAPANGDGRRFRSADGAELAVFGHFNALDMTPETLIEQARSDATSKSREVTYAASGADWAVLSGHEDSMIFYERHEFGANGVIHVMVLRYPESLHATYDALAGIIARSLEGP